MKGMDRVDFVGIEPIGAAVAAWPHPRPPVGETENILGQEPVSWEEDLPDPGWQDLGLAGSGPSDHHY